MSRYPTLGHAVEQNERLQCTVPECTKHRVGVSHFCRQHRQQYERYGHPLQSKLRRSHHAVERRLVAEVFQSNRDHPGVLQAVQWVQEWMDSAVKGEPGSVLAYDDLRRLHDHGVTARDIVIESAAAYLYSVWNPHKFQTDETADVAMSYAVLQLAPLAKRTVRAKDGSTKVASVALRAAPRKKVGKWIKSHLSPLFANLRILIEKNRNAELSAQEALRSPLVYPAKLTPIKQEHSEEHHHESA